MNTFLSLNYWFNLKPDDLHASAYYFFALLIIVFVAIIFLFQTVRKRKNNVYFKIWRTLNSFAITNLIIALFLLFFQRETIYVFSARFWLLIWFLEMAVWMYFVVKFYKKVPEIKQKFEKDKEYKKYIP